MAQSVFEGLKVADFTTAIAGPLSTRYLAEEGATVVKVECHKYLDSVRMTGPFKNNVIAANSSVQWAFYNVSKYSISPDMAHPRAQEIARRLVKWADVVVENMTPESMVRWGLDYKSCQQFRPDIIYLTSSALGREGPLASYVAWGYHLGPLVGFSHLAGWPDRRPVVDNIAYTDPLGAAFSVIALVGALLYRRRTGKGIYIDQTQAEAGLYFQGPTLMDYFANGRVACRDGNRDPQMVPHGVFPCPGNDRWVAIAVRNEEEWRSFCRALGKEEWLQDKRFATAVARKEHESELETLISEWTMQRTPQEAMDFLQAAGVAAGAIHTSEDIFNDPQLRHREHFGMVDHQVVGPYTYELPPFKYSKIPDRPQRPAPLLGENNDYILKEMLGYTDDEIGEFLADGVLTVET